MWAERRAMQRAVARPGNWIVNADLDEHYEFPAPLRKVVAYCRHKGANCVQGPMIDRSSPGGILRPVANALSLAEQFPVEADV